MKNTSKFRSLALVGVFTLLSVSLSSCFMGGYGGYGYNNYYSRPYYGYSYGYRPQVRVYVAPRRNYSYHDNYRRNYGGGSQNYSRSYGNRNNNGHSRGGHR